MPSPLRVLLVEDSAGDARLLQLYLEDAGLGPHALDHVGTLAEARAALQRAPADVVLLDLSLPDAHGFETVEAALSAAPGIPIVVLTGLDDERVAVHAVQSGAQDYLVKGQVEPGVLGRAIRYAIERMQLAREREALLTAEQAARGRAESAVRARDQVLRVVSHDLGNHLAAIRIGAAVLARSLGDPAAVEELRRQAGGILEQVAVMDRLRQDLLDVASIEAGRLSVTIAPVDPMRLLEAAAEYAGPMARQKGIELRIRDREPPPPVRADSDRILQALGNLVGNAIKFTPPGAAVTLDVTPEGNEVVFSVEDEGDGIEPENVERIFESFWKSGRGNAGGAGLGLSIVRGIAAAHGGRAWYEPGTPGGSTFRLALPRSPTG